MLAHYYVATAQVLYIRTDTIKATPLRSVAYLTSTSSSQVSGLLPLMYRACLHSAHFSAGVILSLGTFIRAGLAFNRALY